MRDHEEAGEPEDEEETEAVEEGEASESGFTGILGAREELAAWLQEDHTALADSEAEQGLRLRLQDLLNQLASIADDDRLWRRFQESARSLTSSDLERLGTVADERLVPLLTFLGYKDPPPPSAEVLVDEVAAAVNRARGLVATGRAEAAVVEVRNELKEFVQEVESRIAELPGGPPRRKFRTLRHWARRTLEVARRLIPPVVGAGAAAAVMFFAPGLSGGILAIVALESTKEASKQLFELATAALIGQARALPGGAPVASTASSEEFQKSMKALTASVEGLGRVVRGETSGKRLLSSGDLGQDIASRPINWAELQKQIRRVERALLSLEFLSDKLKTRTFRKALAELYNNPGVDNLGKVEIELRNTRWAYSWGYIP